MLRRFKAFLGWSEMFRPMDEEDDESIFKDELRRPDWSVYVDDSHLYSESKTPICKSDLGSVAHYSGRYIQSDRLILIFGIVGLGSLLAASVLAYNKWGGAATHNQFNIPAASPYNSTVADPSGQPSGDLYTSSPTTGSLPWEPVSTLHPTRLPTYPPTTSPSVLPFLSSSTQSPSRMPTLVPSSSPSPEPIAPAPSSSPSKEPITQAPSISPSNGQLPQEPTYMPGNLTTSKLNLLLSEGLDCRIIALSGHKVPYDLGGSSSDVFHLNPDAGAAFPDPRASNPEGWIYTSNSEVDFQQGGVGALTFDKNGNVIDYRMLLKNSTMNCGGGRTPWDTWVSCEEIENTGVIYQVDPTGERNAQIITLGSDGGRWESFAYDDRDRNTPRFFATEDHSKGAVRRFTPDNPNWDDPWEILHGSGKTDFLVLFPNETLNGGTFVWTDNLDEARMNAKQYYPMTEGIDVYKGTMVFTCKKIYVMFVLDLDTNTYYNQTTLHGLFDGKPDQVERVLGDTQDLLYFTEEGGVDAGVHARDHLGRFYTIFESPVYPDETTGLSFSPDGRFMFTAYQKTGVLYTIWRKDGLPFQASHLDVKFHNYQPQ